MGINITTSHKNADAIEFRCAGKSRSNSATGTPVMIACSIVITVALSMIIHIKGAGRKPGYQMPCKANSINAFGENMPFNTLSAATAM